MSHTHIAGKIEYRGRVDSVYIECMRCSHIECVGVWWTDTPKGWSKKQWPKLHAAICLYLDAMEALHRTQNGFLMASFSPLLSKIESDKK